MALRKLLEPGPVEWKDILEAMNEVEEFRDTYTPEERTKMRRRLGTMHRARHNVDMRFDIWWLDALLAHSHPDIIEKYYVPCATVSVTNFPNLPAHILGEFSGLPFLSFSTQQCMDFLISMVLLIYQTSVGFKPLALDSITSREGFASILELVTLRIKLLASSVLPAEYFDDAESKDTHKDGNGYADIDWIREAYHLSQCIESVPYLSPHVKMVHLADEQQMETVKAYLRGKASLLKPDTRVQRFQRYLARVSLTPGIEHWYSYKFERHMEGLGGGSAHAMEQDPLQKVLKLDLDFGIDLKDANMDTLVTHPHFYDFCIDTFCEEVVGCPFVFHPGLPLKYVHAARMWTYDDNVLAAPSVLVIMLELVHGRKQYLDSNVQDVDDNGLDVGIALPATFFKRVFVDCND